MTYDHVLSEYKKLTEAGYNPSYILVEVDKDGYIVQQRGPTLSHKIKPKDIEFKNPSV